MKDTPIYIPARIRRTLIAAATTAVFAVIVFLVAVFSGLLPNGLPFLPVTTAPVGLGMDARAAHVTRVVDGDTIVIDWDDTPADDQATVRLIGVDTPETVDPDKPVECGGLAASNYTEFSLLGEAVFLQADPTQDDADRYERLLRYVYLPDGALFQERLVQDGMAYEYTYDVPYEQQATLIAAQDRAQAARAGLWNGECEATS